MNNDKRHILSINSFELLLTKILEEYKNQPQLSKIIPHVERGNNLLLRFTEENKIKPFLIEKNGLNFTWIEVDNSKVSEKELEQLKGISSFLLSLEEKLGYTM